MRPIMFAHRGARLEEPENTLAAFGRALELGADGLETDAWLSRDGAVVLVHDRVVRRGVRRRRVGTTDAADLARLGVPRLVDLYGSLGHDFELSIDLQEAAVAEPLLEVVERHGDPARCWACTPDVDLAGRLAASGRVRAVHSQRRDRITGSLERHAAVLGERGVAAMNMHHRDWTPGLVSLFHRFSVRAFAWDAQEVRHLRSMLRIGIDALYCDRPARMVATVGEWTTADGGAESG